MSDVLFPRMQRERADLEQNFAREIGNLVKSLREEKDELEAELQLKMDRETMLLRWVLICYPACNRSPAVTQHATGVQTEESYL